jgi:proline dehydrogenase
VLPSLERLRDDGYLTTVDVLGESVETADACGMAAGRYEETLDALAAGGLERNVSLKLTQMGLDIDRDLCRDTVARVFRTAADVGAFVRVDMEDHTKTDKTLELWRELRRLNRERGHPAPRPLVHVRQRADVVRARGSGFRRRFGK